MKKPNTDITLKNYPRFSETPLVIRCLENGCGPRAIWSVLKYFGIRCSADRIVRECGYRASDGTDTLAAAIALHRFGLDAAYHSDRRLALEKRANVEAAASIGLSVCHSLPLAKVLAAMRKGWVPIVAFLDGKEGHLSPLIGRRANDLEFFDSYPARVDMHEFVSNWDTPRHKRTCVLVRPRTGRARSSSANPAVDRWLAAEKKRLDRFAAQSSFVNVHIDGSDKDIEGIVIGHNRDVLLLVVVKDFLPDGFAAVNLRSVVAIERDKTERHFERVFRKAKGYTELPRCPVTNMSSIRHLLRQLQQRQITAGVEWIEADGGSSFVLGSLTQLGPASFSVLGFDTLSEWDDTPTEVPYTAATAITFGDRYSQLLSAHAHAHAHATGNPPLTPQRRGIKTTSHR